MHCVPIFLDKPLRLAIPILDSQRRLLALLGGTPDDVAGWKLVTDGAYTLLDERLPRLQLTADQLHHRRAQDAYPAVSRGWSHGGGQTEPGELSNNVANTQATDELLAHPHYNRISTFVNRRSPAFSLCYIS